MTSLFLGPGHLRSAARCIQAALPWLLLPVLLGGCSGEPPSPAATASMTVTVATPARRSIDREVVASGSVEAWQEMSLGVELSGVRVSQVLVEVGAEVKAGQPLVLLDRRTLEVQARQAEASLAQARAGLEVARAAATRGDSLLAQKLISTSGGGAADAKRQDRGDRHGARDEPTAGAATDFPHGFKPSGRATVIIGPLELTETRLTRLEAPTMYCGDI